MKYKFFILLLLIASYVHATIVVDPNCTINFGASDVYISGGMQIDLVKDQPKYPVINYDPGSRLYFVGSGDADLTNVYLLYNATIDKPSGDLYMGSNLTITGNLDFVSGNLITGANTLTLDQVLNGTLSGESATSYVVGTVVASRAIGSGTSTFGNIGFAITNTGNNLGTATVTREAGAGTAVNIYGSNGISRKWTLGTSIGFTGTRSVTSEWLSNEDNGNTLADLKVWKYEASKGAADVDEDKENLIKSKVEKFASKSAVKSEIEESVREEVEEEGYLDERDVRTLGWVEVDGAVFNYASSPRTATFSIDAETVFTINDALNAFADGSGTISNPYQIETLDQLNSVRYYLDAHFIQIADIDASETSTWDSGAGWSGIYNFAGIYNGDGHTVSNLFINRSAESYQALFGRTTGATINDLGIYGSDITGATYVGNLIGLAYNSTINNCYADGDVKGNTEVGSFAGRNSTSSVMNNCYAYGTVTRASGQTSTYLGGFVGVNYNQINDCYSTSSVHYEGATDPVNRGFVGYNTGSTNNTFWNTELSGQSSSSGTPTGLTTDEMRTLATFTDAGWDFQDETANGTDDVWGMNFLENNSFPFLSWQEITHDPISGFAGGMGTESEPFLVSTPAELDNVRNFIGVNFDDTYFLQISDLDLSSYQAGEGWQPLGSGTTASFRGSYDGDSHEITNMIINRPTTDFVGLFGCTRDGEIKNLILKNTDVTGRNYTGGLAGYSYTNTTITNCANEGSITGVNYVGGLTGTAYSNTSISNCFSSGSATGASYVGGFIGRQYSCNINDSYTIADVVRTSGSASVDFGGFIGDNDNYSDITNCYSAGSVSYTDATDPTDKGFAGVLGTISSTITDSFWDTEASGQSSSAGSATGKTTAEMQDVYTYTATATAGLTTPWDFVGDPYDDGETADIWNIHTSLNGGYPFFDWEGRIPVSAPANVALVYDGSNLSITWDAVSGATGYAVYSSDDPYGTFSLDLGGSLTGEQWSTTIADSKMFYFITATNDTKEIPVVIKMNNTMADR